jgi:hypothetical protein
LSAKYNLICDQATTFNFQFVIQDEVGTTVTPWNLTNYTATMTIRPFVGSTTTTFVATTANGGITLGGIDGRITVNISAANTADFDPSRYAYDLVINSGSVITRVLEGKFVVTGGVTV